MASGSFARGKEEKAASASMVFIGNINQSVDVLLKTSHLFDPFPEAKKAGNQIPAFFLACLAPPASLTGRKLLSVQSQYLVDDCHASQQLGPLKKEGLVFNHLLKLTFQVAEHLPLLFAQEVRQSNVFNEAVLQQPFAAVIPEGQAAESVAIIKRLAQRRPEGLERQVNFFDQLRFVPVAHVVGELWMFNCNVNHKNNPI